ncbi:hypothetical protein A2833_02865 [Candidatus Azambacteria bacterium RIFCSPHIGHO2_01_FULL_44_55]|uniref:Peptidase M50 domain-containing protein n=1 Tax=Candidatus Azambacteria bacterium RIFCSPLOWO2_02_FULL_44_14 TaxID=1797306 RepID=A0A1F5CBY4_9BACT|nr:MAG: hypothetical protein A3A18_02755 [Candidatus Azambacteria bacterium RIFCSPLOWO2_01_FULL_44_84]OGD33229.1 MAG: hypothetical protein A3C78_03160 [Candidatus Azambacteria bacterium RIFCSPHIGHO2_02_FULL_45_18]OGD40334.1 MAG: hypothetical protein A3I30_03520 [Candidatus Azambacteria bacterium RIFCSPLOWO2_02_FULL_44_14]OGD40697.1 MAG: hypothetical protein A2833_02865 [Candidatus Azambacteria bacterium RIFCSPHIGHO2_01_FULL_44_55]OGD52064.1 MAG: hypothetical protein A2608_01870 [Candidatus Azam
MGNWLRNLRFWLFVATFISCAFAATWYAGQFDIYNPLSIKYGLPFAFALMFILLSHELGHYFAAKWWGVEATGPMFIPLPIIPLGTLGAMITMNAKTIPNRKALFDIGVAGPWAGTIATIALLFPRWGDYLTQHSVDQISFAIVIGVLLTLANLMPFGQLDGGHVLYAATGAHYQRVKWVIMILAATFILVSQKIIGPATVLIFIFFGGINHWPTNDDMEDLDAKRKFLVALTVLLFVSLTVIISLISHVIFSGFRPH